MRSIQTLILLFSILPLILSGCKGYLHVHPELNPKTTSSHSPSASTASEPSHSPSLFPKSPYQDIDQIVEGKIVHLPTGVEISEQRLIKLLAPSRIIYVGETHDSLEDHQIQLEILKKMVAQFPGRVVVGMEMFKRPAQPQLDQWIEGKLGDKEFLKLWHENWRVDMGYYESLLNFIKENKIPVIALNASKEVEAKVKMKGLKGFSEQDDKQLPQIDRNDPYHRQTLEAIFKGHGTGSEGFNRFYDTMLLWDETMAESIANYLISPEGANKKMVVFAGGFHVSYGFGIPRRVFRRVPEPYQIVISHTKDIPQARRFLIDIKLPDVPVIIADFVWGVGYQELKTEKVRLGVRIESVKAGLRVLDVVPNSAAESAGIQPGDVIVSFGGETMIESFDLIYAVQQKKSGDHVKIKLIRKDKVVETEAIMTSFQHP